MPDSKTSKLECHLSNHTFRLRGMPKAKTEGPAMGTKGSMAHLQEQCPD
jgi:hypothetical protein